MTLPVVYVAGKGPSLDGFDWSRAPAGARRVAINESVLVVPDAVCVAQDFDVVRRVLGAWAHGSAPLRIHVPERFLDTYKALDFFRAKAPGEHPVQWASWTDAQVPPKQPTAVPAMFVAWCFARGPASVRMVGMDRFFDADAPARYASVVKRATNEDIEKQYRMCPYDGYNSSILRAIARWGHEVVDATRG